MVTKPVHIVVTCTNRKVRTVPPHMRLRNVNQTGTAGKFDAWIRLLASSSLPTVTADQLYAGDQWQVARTLHTAVPSAQTWVCSAGYGLVPLNAELRPYAATFATDQEDRVGDTTEKIQQWWQYLNTWHGPNMGTPRSIATLANSAPEATLIAVLSGSYLRAIGPDLHRAAAELNDPDQLSIISAGTGLSGPWDEYLLPTDARLQASLGGSLGSLNVRIAAALLRNPDLRRTALTTQLRELVAASAPRPKLNRTPMSDTEVREFILGQLTPKSSHSSMLRQLRNAGLACEQNRFRRLFLDTAGGE